MSALNLETPVQSVFDDEQSATPFLKLSPHSMSNIMDISNLEQLLDQTGYASYIGDFHQTGINSVVELIRFATQYLPAGLNVTPAPAAPSSPTPFPYPHGGNNNHNNSNPNRQQIKFTADRDNNNNGNVSDDSKDDEKEMKQYPQEAQQKLSKIDRTTRASHDRSKPFESQQESKKDEVPTRSGRNKKHKLRLYEVEELLDDDVYCEYALLIRDGGNPLINGYYTCSGKKNDHYMFNHMNDNKAALYAAKNGTWMIVYDDELLYGNPLKYDSIGGRDILLLSELNLYPPPPRCWYAIEGVNPPPGVMWLEITDNPMAYIDEEMANNLREKNLNEMYMNQLKVDLPVQMIDFMFCGPIGFALRIDDTSKIMDVIRIREDGQAKELGLKHGDTLLKINEEDISKRPDIAFPMLKESVQSEQAFEVTFLRKKYDELVINVQRAGTPGIYIYIYLCVFPFIGDGVC